MTVAELFETLQDTDPEAVLCIELQLVGFDIPARGLVSQVLSVKPTMLPGSIIVLAGVSLNVEIAQG